MGIGTWTIAWLLERLADEGAGSLIRHAFSRSAKFILRGTRTDFLEYDYKTLNKWYYTEPRLASYLPYKEVISWVDQIINNMYPSIPLKALNEPFSLAKGNNKWNEVQSEGYVSYRKAGHAKRDSRVIRLNNISTDANSKILYIQPAMYLDQARSNLILDYKALNGSSLREILRDDYGARLPPLDDGRLANTIGMALIIIYADEKGRLVPYLVRRAENLAVFPGGLHPSTTCAAEWKEGRRVSFDDLLLADLLDEVKEETDLEPHELGPIYPMALCREFLRAGKPQFFLFSTTGLTADQLRKRREIARKRNKKFNPEKEEVLSDQFWRIEKKAPQISSEAVYSASNTMEAAVALHYLNLIVQGSRRKNS